MTVEGPEDWEALLAGVPAEVAEVARQARRVVRAAIPDAAEEVDASARLLGFTFAPGTYKGLVAGLALHDRYVNLMFSQGAELADSLHAGSLLAGTGKKARHVKLQSPADLLDPRLAELLAAAAQRGRDRMSG
ncbi:hypothetical protein [Streptomyces sp. NPDC090022]|uniref:hypothetical protein n=1 Tax=Streptomyces sp. NPDC090022 TaxID=3365920 RepID=UPI00382CD973